MRRPLLLNVALASVLAIASRAADKAAPQWLTGKVIDANRARYLAAIHHSTQSSSEDSGTWGGTAQSTSTGNTTNTNINGTYSGQSTRSSSGLDMPLYRVYENLIIEGDDMVYVTQERIRWRWSKAARVTVNGEVKYYVADRKLHVLDDGGKEHTIEIVKQIKKEPLTTPANDRLPSTVPPAQVAQAAQGTTLEITSAPLDADIEFDGNFVGNTPSSLASIPPGDHALRITKSGYTPWERRLKTSGGTVKIAPELEPIAQATSK